MKKKKASEIKIGDIIIERYRVEHISPSEKKFGEVLIDGPIINMREERMANLAWTVDSETEFEVE